MLAKFLIGQNIYLRAFEKKDISKQYLSWVNNHNIVKFMDTCHYPKSINDLEIYYKDNKRSKTNILFSVILKKHNKHIGNATISNINWIHRNCYYGRLIGQNTKLKNIGSEVLNLLQYYVFEKLNLNSMVTSVAEDNIASIKSNIKCGMKKVGNIQDSVFLNSKYCNEIIFQMTKTQYKKISKLRKSLI
tara:strand:- start:539 stop:1105 length:567 start_codon:yes stop_codon:yes gene_type:complete